MVMEQELPDLAPGRRYGGRDAIERRAERRRRLLDVGLDRFAGFGRTAVSVGELCRSAGVATSHFYELFDNRDDLLIAVFREGVDGAQAAVDEGMAATADADPATRMRAALAGYLGFMLGDPRRALINSVESVGVSVELEQERRAVVARYAQRYLDEAADALGLDRTRVRRRYRYSALALMGGVDQAVLQWLDAARRPSVATLVDQVALTFVATGRAITEAELAPGG